MWHERPRVVVELTARIVVARCSRKRSTATRVDQSRLHRLAAKSADCHRGTRSQISLAQFGSFRFQLQNLNTQIY